MVAFQSCTFLLFLLTGPRFMCFFLFFVIICVVFSSIFVVHIVSTTHNCQLILNSIVCFEQTRKKNNNMYTKMKWKVHFIIWLQTIHTFQLLSTLLFVVVYATCCTYTWKKKQISSEYSSDVSCRLRNGLISVFYCLILVVALINTLFFSFKQTLLSD